MSDLGGGNVDAPGIMIGQVAGSRWRPWSARCRFETEAGTRRCSRAQDRLGSAVAGAAASPAALQPDGAPEMSGVRVQPTFSLASSRFLTRLRDNA